MTQTQHRLDDVQGALATIDADVPDAVMSVIGTLTDVVQAQQERIQEMEETVQHLTDEADDSAVQDEIERRPAPGESDDDVDFDKQSVPMANLWAGGHPIGHKVERTEEAITETRERVDELHETIVADSVDTSDCTLYNGVPEGDMTWLERYYHHGRDGVTGTIHERDTHAKVLLERLPDWAFEAHSGAIVLPTANNLKKRLERAVTDEIKDKPAFSYQELYRACEVIEKRTQGKIQYMEDHPKIGRHLRIPNPDEVAINTDVIGGPQPTDGDYRKVVAAV